MNVAGNRTQTHIYTPMTLPSWLVKIWNASKLEEFVSFDEKQLLANCHLVRDAWAFHVGVTGFLDGPISIGGSSGSRTSRTQPLCFLAIGDVLSRLPSPCHPHDAGDMGKPPFGILGWQGMYVSHPLHFGDKIEDVLGPSPYPWDGRGRVPNPWGCIPMRRRGLWGCFCRPQPFFLLSDFMHAVGYLSLLSLRLLCKMSKIRPW